MCHYYLTLYAVLFILGPALDCNVISPISTKSLLLLSHAVSRSTDHMLHTDHYNLEKLTHSESLSVNFTLVQELLLQSHVIYFCKRYANSYLINKKLRRVYQINHMIDARIISSKNVPCPMNSIQQGVDNYYKTQELFQRQVQHSIRHILFY